MAGSASVWCIACRGMIPAVIVLYHVDRFAGDREIRMVVLSSTIISSDVRHECDNLVPREVVHALHHKFTCRRAFHALNDVARSVNTSVARLSSPISGDLSITRIRAINVVTSSLQVLHVLFLFDG